MDVMVTQICTETPILSDLNLCQCFQSLILNLLTFPYLQSKVSQALNFRYFRQTIHVIIMSRHYKPSTFFWYRPPIWNLNKLTWAPVGKFEEARAKLKGVFRIPYLPGPWRPIWFRKNLALRAGQKKTGKNEVG